MKFVRSLESFIGSQLEGFFNKKFSSSLQPVEIAKQIRRKLESEKTVGLNVYIPDQYTVFLGSLDFAKLEASFSLITKDLTTYIVDYAKRKNYMIPGKVSICIQLDDMLPQGVCRVTADFSEICPADDHGLTPENDDISGTRVFSRPFSGYEQPHALSGTLSVVEGLETGLVVSICTKRINIGRRESAELSLHDLNVSRLHAYIVYEQGSHIIYDAKSLNGTYVNNHRIIRKQLQTGDKIGLGNTIILYEVR